MKAAISIALLLFVGVATSFLVVVGHDLHQDHADVHVVLANAAATIKHLDQTIGKVDTAADTLNSAATEERSNWQQTSKEAAKTGLALRELIDDLRQSSLHVNLVTLPAVDAQIRANGDQLSSTIAKLGSTADGLTAATVTLNARLGDPAIPQLLGQLNVAAVQLAEASGHANKILNDGEIVADHYKKEIMAPVSLGKRIGEYLLTFGSDARVLFAGGK